jgi:16S rRNA (cytidine1402-2'-O)-methyltransferase
MQMKNKGSILLFPCPIADGHVDSLAPETIRFLHQTTHFIVEKAKTARRFISASKHPIPISQLEIFEINDDKAETQTFLMKVFDGIDIGVISEAGCPGVADPGSEVVDWAHHNDIRVVPYVGPSSILLYLMASGFNGQSFAFNGYLSNKKPELIQQLKSLETKVLKTGQTQMFMETPYRNAFMIEACVMALQPNTKLCICCDINSPTEYIRQQSIKNWKKTDPNQYHKRPCIYIIG